MTAGQIRKALAMYKDEQKVFICYPSHDYWHTVVADEVEEVKEMEMAYSVYHEKYAIVTPDDNKKDEDVVIGVVIS